MPRLPRRIVPAAGERWFHPHDLTFRHLLEQLLESLVHFDGRLLRTVRVLVAQPGRLTVDFLRGCRRPYVAPFHLFLVANLVFLVIQVFSGLNPVIALVLLDLNALGISLNTTVLDWIATLLEGALCVVYLAKSAGAFYQTAALRAWMAAGLLTVTTMHILYGYRLILFLVTFWTT